MTTCISSCYHCNVVFSFFAKDMRPALKLYAILFILIFSLFLTPWAAQAQMTELSDNDLKGITGQSGVSINMDGTAQIHYDLFKFSDTQAIPNWIELRNFTVDNGAGGGFSFATQQFNPVELVTNFLIYYGGQSTDPLGANYNPNADPLKAAYTWANNKDAIYSDAKVQDGTIVGLASLLALDPNTIDVATDANGRTFVQLKDSSNMNPRWYSIGDFGLNCYSAEDSLYHYQSLGSLNLDALQMGPSVYRLWAHAASGISFDYQTAITASALTYTYNTTPLSLKLSGLHIAGSAAGDPTDPTTWTYSGNFKIGTIGDADVYDVNNNLIFTGNTPATIDIATDSSNDTSIYMSLPMSGSIRVGEVNFGGQSFGPIAIDGIQVHRLTVQISGKL